MSALRGYYVSTKDQPRVRRAADGVRVAVGALLLFVAVARTDRTGALEGSLLDFAEAVPDWTATVFWIGYQLAAVYVIVALIGLLWQKGRDWSGVTDVVLSVVAAGVVAGFAMQIAEGVWPPFSAQLGIDDPKVLFPMVRVAVVTAAVIAISPYVTRPVRRLGSVMVFSVIVSSFFLGFGDAGSAAAGIGIGLLAAGAVHLIWGSPSGYPTIAEVTAALGELGIETRDLSFVPDQSWGTRRMAGTDAGGRSIAVKAYGRDASDSQLAAKLWRTLWYRDTGPNLAYSRMQSVEHEALVTVFAARAGVPTPEPIAAATAGDDVAILAMAQPTSPFVAEEATDEVLAAVWRSVVALHDADIAHGSLNVAALATTKDGPLITDFANGSVAAGDRRRLDVVELLFSLSRQIGDELAVASAQHGLGPQALVAILPYMQLPALSRATRRAATKPKAAMKALRAHVAESTGTEVPDPVKLRRVSIADLLKLGLLLLAASALISQLGDIDFVAVWEELRDANWVVLLMAFPLAHLSFFFEATGMVAAVGRPLPLWPVTVLQLSARFIGLAVPSAAGRIAMNTAFLRKYGLSATVAVVQGAIDGVSGFIVEASILVVALILSDFTLNLEGDTNWQLILLIALMAVVIGGLVVLGVTKLRQLVVPVLKDALGAVVPVLKDPKRAISLLASNLMSRLMLAMTLWLILRGMGIELGLATALVVTVATNLLAGLVPIPGGIGVAEAVMTSWLVLVGVPEEGAFAATIVYRMWTFYIPAVEGLPTMKWLEKRDYL